MKKLLTKLSVETFLFDLTDKITTAPILTNGTVCLVDEGCIEVTIDKSVMLNDIFAQLSEQNIHVQSMRNKSNRLEELFMGIVTDG